MSGESTLLTTGGTRTFGNARVYPHSALPSFRGGVRNPARVTCEVQGL